VDRCCSLQWYLAARVTHGKAAPGLSNDSNSGDVSDVRDDAKTERRCAAGVVGSGRTIRARDGQSGRFPVEKVQLEHAGRSEI
jgi:hypothetical protein